GPEMDVTPATGWSRAGTIERLLTALRARMTAHFDMLYSRETTDHRPVAPGSGSNSHALSQSINGSTLMADATCFLDRYHDLIGSPAPGRTAPAGTRVAAGR